MVETEGIFRYLKRIQSKKTMLSRMLPLSQFSVKERRASQQTTTIGCKVDKIPFKGLLTSLSQFVKVDFKKLSNRDSKFHHFTP